MNSQTGSWKWVGEFLKHVFDTYLMPYRSGRNALFVSLLSPTQAGTLSLLCHSNYSLLTLLSLLL